MTVDDLRVAPHIPVGFGIGARTGGFDEPGMLVGSVIENKIHDDADVALACLGGEAIKIGHRAVLRIDRGVVGDVVAEVDLWRRVDGRQPDRIDAERLQVVEARCDAVEIADSVAVGILETARIDLVDDRVLPPVGIRLK